MATTIHDIVSELQSFLEVSPETLDRALDSPITDKNHAGFRLFVKAWCNGHYDEDPDILLRELENLL